MSGSGLAARLFAPFGRLFDLRGRTARRDFWPYILLLFVGWLVFVPAVFTAFGGSALAIIFVMTSPAGWFVLADILFLPFILLGFAAVVRRLHDIGVNALPMIAYVLLDGASIGCFQLLRHLSLKAGGSNVAQMAEFVPGMALGLPGLFMPICFVALVVMCAKAGTKGPNRYGPDPLEAADA